MTIVRCSCRTRRTLLSSLQWHRAGGVSLNSCGKLNHEHEGGEGAPLLFCSVHTAAAVRVVRPFVHRSRRALWPTTDRVPNRWLSVYRIYEILLFFPILSKGKVLNEVPLSIDLRILHIL